MKPCENCGKEENSIYGSGRFCSSYCAKSFSTKKNREEINLKISEANKGKGVGEISLICKNCNNEFFRDHRRRNQKFCSRSCSSSHSNKDLEFKEKIRNSRINFLKEGNYSGYGNKSYYNFKGKEIRCDSHIERSCINYFENLGAIDIDRSGIEIRYGYKGSDSIYIPDFKVVMLDQTIIVEAKSYMSVKKIDEKWREYNEKSELKKEALSKYCKENGFESFWFTKDKNLKYYRSLINSSVAQR
jgi:hypothetical protein